MKKLVTIQSCIFLILLLQACNEKKAQPPSMISVPQFEFISKSTINDSTKNINISLDAFYISNEITNKQYREFTDWAKDNPAEILAKPKEIIVKKYQEPGKTNVLTIPYWVKMSELLPMLIDSNAMYKIDKKLKNYFTDEKYNDYPVVGVSKNAADYYCTWLERLEQKTINLRKGQIAPDGMCVNGQCINGKFGKEKVTVVIGPSYGFYRIPLEMEWEFVTKQPYEKEFKNDHILHKVNEGIPDRWGILHLHDNVSEWIKVPEDTLAICAGDNWLNQDNLPQILRMHPDSSKGYIGFRIARTFKPEEINKKQDN